jgi:Mg2+ and Co2+ transporter CorA
MNVIVYPHAGTEAGGVAALGLMAGLVAILYVVFKRADWL